MGDRHPYGSSSRYSRPRSPVMSNPGRMSLPNVGYVSSFGGYGESIYPSRDITSQPRSSGDRLTAAVPTTTTKYRVIPTVIENPRSSATRGTSRTRSATVDSSGRSLAVSQAPRLGPVIHHPRNARPASPLSNPYRASDEAAYVVPATSNHHHHHRGHHRNGYSIDNGTEYRAKNRDWDHSRISSGRENTAYLDSRGRSSHSSALVTASDDYLDSGYSYTNPREFVKYELDHTLPRHLRHRRDTSESRSRPASVTGTADLGGAKSFDARERGPPPATRGREKLPTTRATFDVPARPRAELVYESDSRSRKPRPVSMYQERELPRTHHDAAYGSRETEVRERAPREKAYHQSRHDDDDRLRGSEKHGHGDRKEHKDHKSRDSIAATFVAAASALGLGAAVQSKDNDRDDRDEPSRRSRDDSDEDRRRRRKAEDIDPTLVDLSSRNPREKARPRETGRNSSPPYERDGEYKRDSKDRHSPDSSQSPPREKRSSPPISNDNRTRHETVNDHPKEQKSKNRSSSLSDSTQSSDLSSSEKDRRSRREKERTRIEPPTPTTPSAAFNPKNTMDLRALKAQLNRQEEPRETKRPIASSVAVAPPTSTRDRSYDSREDDRGRRDLIDETQPPKELREPQHQIRVVSPPRETQIAKSEEKPVKGILRTPRDKFPEDPTHIREGVAPLKDAKKDGVPPDARWTKISRSMVNPAALEAGKERYEEQDDHVIVLRVLSKDEIQAYATITESIRAAREEEERDRQRRRRRERHERHKRERAEHHRSSRRRKEEDSESDTTEEDDRDRDNDHVRSIEAPDAPRPRRIAFEDQPLMSGGLGDLKENPSAPGTFTGYTRNPPVLQPVSR